VFEFTSIALGVSFVFLAFVFLAKRIPLASNFTIYSFFALLYSLFPALVFADAVPYYWTTWTTLSDSELVVATHLGITAACNMAFGSVFLFGLRRYATPSAPLFDRPHCSSGCVLVFVVYIVFCVAMTYLGSVFTYGTGAVKNELVHSLMSNGKVLLSALYILFIVRFGFSWLTVVMLGGYVVLMLVEHSRWYFITVLVTTLVYLQNRGKVSNFKVILSVLGAAALLSYVALIRVEDQMGANLDISIQSWDDVLVLLEALLAPFYGEGVFGSYMALQTYDLFWSGQPAFYTFFLDYIVDPLVYLIPRILYVAVDVYKDDVGIFSYFISSNQPYLDEQYAPLGGFQYLAQAMSAVPFVGPVLITLAFAGAAVWFENRRRRSPLLELHYYLFTAGFGFVFLKTMFHVTVKYYLTLMIPVLILNALLNQLGRHSAYRRAG